MNNNSNNISIPVILYALFFFVSVYYFGMILKNVLGQILFGLLGVINYDKVPFLKLIVLFVQIIFVIKYFKVIISKEINKSSIITILMYAFFGFVTHYLIQYFGLYVKPMLCGNTLLDDNWQETIYGDYNRNMKLVDTLQTFIISTVIGIYSLIKIQRM